MIIGKKFLLILVIASIFLMAFLNPELNIENFIQKKGKEQGIFLNVPADALMNHTRWGADIDSITKEQAIAALEDYVSQYANSQVNRLLLNVNYLRSCYDSKIMEPYWDVPDPANNTTAWYRKYWQINKKGIDVFAVCVDQTRAIKVSPWLSFRMNDHHYRDNPFCLNSLMLENPELRLSPTGSFDYARKEVREYYKAFIKEALERYDVDGIELDWMRTFNLFKPGMETEGIEIINSFMKEIRAMVDKNAKDRGHPVEIAARIPVTPSIGRSYGLDGVAWAKDHSVDIIIPSNFFRPTNFDIPVEIWKNEIGKGNKCMIVPGADAAFFSLKNKSKRHMLNSIETMRAFSISAYSRGAGSVYLFNNHSFTFNKKIVNADGTISIVNDKPAIIKEGGKLSTVKGKPRRHVFTFTNPDLKSAPVIPTELKKDSENKYTIYTGPKSGSRNYIIRVALELMPAFENADLEVKINDNSCIQIEDMPRDPTYMFEFVKTTDVGDASETGARVMQFRADLKAVKDGHNTISVLNKKQEAQEISWLEVYLD